MYYPFKMDIFYPGGKIQNRSICDLPTKHYYFNKSIDVKNLANAMQKTPGFPLLQDYPPAGRQHE